MRGRAGKKFLYLLGQLLAGKLMRTRPLLSKAVCTAFSSTYTYMHQCSGAERCQPRVCSILSCDVGGHELSVPKSESLKLR